MLGKVPRSAFVLLSSPLAWCGRMANTVPPSASYVSVVVTTSPSRL